MNHSEHATGNDSPGASTTVKQRFSEVPANIQDFCSNMISVRAYGETIITQEALMSIAVRFFLGLYDVPDETRKVFQLSKSVICAA